MLKYLKTEDLKRIENFFESFLGPVKEENFIKALDQNEDNQTELKIISHLLVIDEKIKDGDIISFVKEINDEMEQTYENS